MQKRPDSSLFRPLFSETVFTAPGSLPQTPPEPGLLGGDDWDGRKPFPLYQLPEALKNMVEHAARQTSAPLSLCAAAILFSRPMRSAQKRGWCDEKGGLQENKMKHHPLLCLVVGLAAGLGPVSRPQEILFSHSPLAPIVNGAERFACPCAEPPKIPAPLAV